MLWNIKQYTHFKESNQQSRAAMRDENKRHAGHGYGADHGADIDEWLDDNEREEASSEQASERIIDASDDL